ncbi:hypothetical protein F4781DRAFT_430506 [Annulohypoxylon bovei var. microspora]|nr:hypothetical protein F4781DRAFT_430506 [Annulohypoxylon bovei var. microspora]
MAGFTSTNSTTQMANFGRSGYNKDGDNEDDKRNFGRSGYNKDDSDDDKKCFGRSGYNKDGDEEDSRFLTPPNGDEQQLDRLDLLPLTRIPDQL